MDNIMKVAVLLTCYNRKEKTIKALTTINNSIAYYNDRHDNKIDVHFFLTDDGCTDGTAEEVKNMPQVEAIDIIKSDGNSYWAGGMRIAWQKAIDYADDWSFYLLINDDVEFFPCAVEDLLTTHEYILNQFGIGGVYTGFINSKSNPEKIIYGAKTYKKSLLSKAYDLKPTGVPQKCLMVNANILMVCPNVVDVIGQLDKGFAHGAADWDFGIRASEAGFPVFTTANVCGCGENDHDNNMQEKEKVLKMSFAERKSFLNKPNKGYSDALFFFKRHNRFKYVLTFFAYYVNLLFPRLFYNLNHIR